MNFKKSAFIYSLRQNLIGVFLVALVLFLSNAVMKRSMRNVEQKNCLDALDNGMAQFTDQIQNVNDYILAIRDAVMVNGHKTIQRYDANMMNDTKTRLSKMVDRNNLIADVALVYEMEDLVITSTTIYPNMEQFANLYQVEGMTQEIFRNYTADTRGLAMIRYIPCSQIQKYGQPPIDTAMCYAIPLDTEGLTTKCGVAYVFIERSSLLDVLVPSHMSAYVSVELYANSSWFPTNEEKTDALQNNPHLLMAYEAKEYGKRESIVTETVTQGGSLQAISRISSRYLDDTFRGINHFQLSALVISVLVGIFASLYSAYRQTLPVRLLLRRLEDRGMLLPDDKNEYRSLAGIAENLLEEKESVIKLRDDYQQTLMNNMLDRLFLSTDPHFEEVETVQMEYASLSDRFYVFYGRIFMTVADNSHSMDLSVMMILEYLSEKMVDGAVLHATDASTFGLLYPFHREEEDMQNIQTLLEQVKEHFPVRIVMVSGGICDSLNQAGVFYEKAQLHYYAIPETDRRGADRMLYPYQDMESDEGFGIRQLQVIYQSISSGEKDMALEAVKKVLTGSLEQGGPELKDRYLILKTWILLASRETLPGEALPEALCGSVPVRDKLANLTEAVGEICDRVDQAKKMEKDNQVNVLMDYIQSHYTDPALCATSLADEFRVSEKYLFVLFKRATGYSPISYLRRIRMEKAIEQMEHPDLTVQQISEMVGYSNFGTFHKAFKREYGMTPGKYRETLVKTRNG